MTIVFHADKNARQRDYLKLKEGEVLVTKIWATIQGEGPFSGEPAVFVRLAGCNLGAKESCPFCDTQFYLHRGQVMAPHPVLDEANKVRENRPKFMVLTGGEPLLQNVNKLLACFIGDAWLVQVETNGYFWSPSLTYLCENSSFLHIVVSPKVNARKQYPKLEKDLLKFSSCLKILVEDVPDSPYYNIPDFAHDYAKKDYPVYLSPINVYKRQPLVNEVASYWDTTAFDLAACERNTRYAAKLAMQYGYRLSLQTHLLAVLE